MSELSEALSGAVPVQALTGADHDPVFRRLVDESDNFILGLVAYGYYTIAKREWTGEFGSTHGRQPDEAERHAYELTCTKSVLERYVAQGKQALSQYSDEFLKREELRIREEAIKGAWWSHVRTALAANAIFAAILVGIAVVARLVGVDLTEVARLGS